MTLKGKAAPQHFITIMATAVMAVVVVLIWLLYEVSVEQQRQRLVEIAQSRAHLIEAIAHFDSLPPHNYETEDGHDTLDHVALAHSKFRGFGQTGEFVLARQAGENIEFLLSHRHNELNKPAALPLNSALAEPMRCALKGESGTLIGRDYRGEMVLASYEPITPLGWGIVVKIDMWELRSPYIKAAAFSVLIAGLLIILGSMAMIRLLQPIFRQLREDSEYQQTLFMNSPLGLALTRMDGTLVDANPAYLDIIGRTAEEMKALSYWDITPEKYAMEEKEQLQQLTQSGCYGPYEKEYIHKEGYQVPVRLSGKIVQKDGEKYIWSSVEDISDRNCAEKRMRQAAAVFDNTDEGIVITDDNNRIIMVNAAFSVITGYAEHEVLGHNPRLLQSGKHSKSFYASLWRQLKEEDNWRGEMWNSRKDGHLIPVWQQIAAIRDEAGRITNYVSTFSDISALKATEEQLAHLAHHDELTGLHNRLYYNAQIEQLLQSARRHQQQIALLYLDLDGFKAVNDCYGHDVGDQLLIEVASRIKNCVRQDDTVARMGGDEFIIILNQLKSHDSASLVAENIIEALYQPIQLQENDIATSTSIGISIYPNDAESATGLQKAADHAMYQAKGNGKSTYKFFSQKM